VPIGQLREAEPSEFLKIPNRIDSGQNLKDPAGLDQPANTLKNIRLRQEDRSEQTPPGKIDRNAIGSRGKFTR